MKAKRFISCAETREYFRTASNEVCDTDCRSFGGKHFGIGNGSKCPYVQEYIERHKNDSPLRDLTTQIAKEAGWINGGDELTRI